MESQSLTCWRLSFSRSSYSPFLKQLQRSSFSVPVLSSTFKSVRISAPIAAQKQVFEKRIRCGESQLQLQANPLLGPFETLSSAVKWVSLLFYKALLVAGIGITVGKPALATPVVIEKTIDKIEDKGTQEAENGLGADFWKDLDLSKGSMELILKNILDADPTNISALECLAKRLVENDDFVRALIVLGKLEILDPSELEWKYMKAQAYDMDGQFELAKEGFENILKLEPFSTRALQGLVIVMDQLSETDEALSIVENTIHKAKKESKTAEARDMGMLIGQFLMLKGKLHEALEQYDDIMDDDKNDFRPYLCQGIIYSILGDKYMAEQRFESYDRLCPKDLPDRKFLDGIMLRAKREGEKLYELKQKQKAQKTAKGGKNKQREEKSPGKSED